MKSEAGCAEAAAAGEPGGATFGGGPALAGGGTAADRPPERAVPAVRDAAAACAPAPAAAPDAEADGAGMTGFKFMPGGAVMIPSGLIEGGAEGGVARIAPPG